MYLAEYWFMHKKSSTLSTINFQDSSKMYRWSWLRSATKTDIIYTLLSIYVAHRQLTRDSLSPTLKSFQTSFSSLCLPELCRVAMTTDHPPTLPLERILSSCYPGHGRVGFSRTHIDSRCSDFHMAGPANAVFSPRSHAHSSFASSTA